jgi:hypothetical protein
MRSVAIAVAASLLFLAACQPAPEQPNSRALREPGAPPPSPNSCVNMDFWGNCTRVMAYRHDQRWRYVRPGARGEERDSSVLCHSRRRVVGEERASRADAQRAAENAWMGSVRYDHGERYQDINQAKDVRHNCDPSSVSAVLKTPHFRCAVEATPCRGSLGATERVERRYEEERDERRR